jgi:phosphatidylglycerol:prolipoprotein diacylglycerol transferase
VLTHPSFDPVALQIGPLAIRWYGLMYLVGFATAYGLGRLRIAAGKSARVTVQALDDLLFFGVLGVILGGRLGYVLFYKPGYYLQHPAEILAVWQGGMAFHGGFLGVLLAVWWVARKHRLGWLEVTDFLAPLAPLAPAGRLGNSSTASSGVAHRRRWGMVFRGGARRATVAALPVRARGSLFVILWLYSSKPRPTGAVSGVFLIGYGVFRFVAEYFREPDDFLGLLALGFSMGQWLSLPMIAAGIGLLTWALRKR